MLLEFDYLHVYECVSMTRETLRLILLGQAWWREERIERKRARGGGRKGTAEGLNRMDGQIKGKKTGLKLKCSLGRHQSEKTGCAPMKHPRVQTHWASHAFWTHGTHWMHKYWQACTHTRLKSLGTHAYIPIQLVHTNYGLGKSVSSVTSTGSLFL